MYESAGAFSENRSADGGLYVPEGIPAYSRADLDRLGSGSVNAAISEIWNAFFDGELTPWDLDFSVGRSWVRLRPIERKMILAEPWHNPEGEMAYFLRFLSERRNAPWAFWAKTAAKISVLGSCLALAGRNGAIGKQEKADIACISGDLSGVLAGVYLKKMGFPVGTVVCCCNENNSVWELIHLGTLRTDGVCIPTRTRLADTVLPEGLEHFLWLLAGERSAVDYAKAAYMGLSYTPSEELLKVLQREVYVSVVSDNRMAFAAAGVLQTTGCLVSPYDALCYAGVQDYRAKSGQNRMCLVLSQRDPALDATVLADALGIPGKQIEAYLRR